MRLFEVLLFVGLLLAGKAHERSHFLSATVGDDITLRCSHKDFSELGVRLFWYKQSLGVKQTLVSTNSKYHKINSLHGEFNSSKRFTLGHETNDLQIKRVQVSDSAVYLCLTGVLHKIDILESYTVIVKSLNVQTEVYQSPHEDAEEGRSVILNCSVHTESCGEQPRVHWFKQSEESSTGVLYSHGGGDGDRCEKTTDRPANSCVYSLPIHNVSSEQTGTYYCAVAACGHVLFGNGTKVKIKGLVDGKHYIIYILSGALAFCLVLVVVLGVSLWTTKKKYHSLSAEFKVQLGSSAGNRTHQDLEVDSLNYAALNIHPASRRQRITEPTDCLYSSVQQH